MPESNTTTQAAAATKPAAAPAKSQAQQLDEIAGLLGAPEKADEQDGDQGGDDQGGGAATDENSEEGAAAEKLNYKLKVPMQDGDPVTLGELKDFYQARQTEKLALIERENTALKQREEVETLISHLDQMPPEILARARARAQATIQREGKLLAEAIPETATTEGMAKMRESIFSLTDHKTVKVLYDFARLREGIKAAKANIKPLRSTNPNATGQASGAKTSEVDARVQRAKQTRNEVDQLAAVDALLKG
jgi:hypothetical protein